MVDCPAFGRNGRVKSSPRVEGWGDSMGGACAGLSPRQQSIDLSAFPPVLCTAPAKYTVFDAEGYVKPPVLH